MNKCMFVGNVVREPELAETSSGISVCSFTIAVNRPYANADGDRDADFINIVAWRGLGENCAEYLTKGSKVAICGSLQTRSYEDKEGNKRYVSEIVASDVEFIKTNKSTEEQAKPSKNANTEAKGVQTKMKLTPVEDDSELPF